ncbi:RNA-directed DNA polymerase from mobile element jockey [Xyrichtys novacula]|uniref:RNA-directed DNA polymerase from mobile element jockey n=1 Tax=Xyrichtys novacula TaxID=13765 RepID=A0AAV1F8Z8_XYRNO|nr:RNA-directed DNA polymerase from mobile element jockey [Xyrichtys novacula]
MFMVRVLQWNARSLMANGQEMKHYIRKMKIQPDVVCVQETFLKPSLDFKVSGYMTIRRDRSEEEARGGCAIFIRQGISYRLIESGEEQEYIVVELWEGGEAVVIVNYYNPGGRLILDRLVRIKGVDRRKVIWCADFNAHNTLWGGKHTDVDGRVVEELMEERELVCLNDGRGTRIDVRTGNESAIDITLVSANLAGVSKWEVLSGKSLGSDHYLIMCTVGGRVEVGAGRGLRKWVYSKAEWNKFREVSEGLLEVVDTNRDVEEVNNSVTTAIITAATQAIPRSRNGRTRKLVPWWSEECSKAVKARNKAFRKIKQNHTMASLLEYQRAQALVRRVVRRTKRESWRQFCNGIGRTTPVGEVWSMIRKMGGDRREWEYPVITEEGETAVNDKEKAEMIARAFAKVHSVDNLTMEGKRRREMTQSRYPGALDRRTDSGGEIDTRFTMAELVRAVRKAKPTAPGGDQVSYVMLKNLGEKGMNRMLELYNKVWEEGRLPSVWKEAEVVPIRKPGKDPCSPSSYRPIALTSNICKIMERMVTERLTYVLEKRGKLARCQSGFRKGRNTMDAVVRLESEVRKAQANKESVVVVFFDIEKAYDMMWKEGLLIKLQGMGIGGRVFNWVKDFLNDRKIQVRIGTEISSKYEVRNGTPQGSVVSPLLFLIMINDVFSEVPADIGSSLFADDGALWKRGRNTKHLVTKVQTAIDGVTEWGLDWGCRFSVEKTQTIIFTGKRVGVDVSLSMYGRQLERVEAFKYLGVVFDKRLTWADHIKRVEGKCRKVLNVMRCLAGREWGASCDALKTVYVAMIRSVIDYGCIVYGSAAKSLLGKLDTIQTSALRICSGAFRTSPVPAVQVELGEMPLCLRRKHLIANYWVSLKGSSGTHPTKGVIEECWEEGKGKREHFGRMGNRITAELGVGEMEVDLTIVYPAMPPWKMIWPTVDWSVMGKKRKEGGQVSLVSVVNQRLREEYSGFVQVYTDGAKQPETGVTGLGVVVPSRGIEINRRTSDGLAVNTVEMLGVMIALKWVEKVRVKRVVICTDSASVLASIRSFHSSSRQGLLYEILQSVTRIVQQGGQISFLWVPAHIGVEGNEKADVMAKEALGKESVELNVRLSKAEVKSMIWEKLIQMWQKKWEGEKRGRHLYKIQESVKVRRLGSGQRKEGSALIRLRLGHCALNKTLKMIGKHQTGLCEGCQVEESVEHVLMGCRRYEMERGEMRSKLRELGMQDLTLKGVLQMGDRAHVRVLVEFLRVTGLIDRI